MRLSLDKMSVRLGQMVWVGSLVPALIGSVWLSITRPYFWVYAIGLGGVTAVVAWWLIPYLGKYQKGNQWVISIAVLNLLWLTPEVFLRVNNFQYETGILFAYPRTFQRLQPDADLFWTLPPLQEGVNSWGFAEAEVTVPKPENVCRLLFLGDSVPAQGYPQLVAEQVQSENGRVEVVNLSLGGYSSYQGRVIAKKYGLLVAPDLVIVSYGWNDHWLAYEAIDSQKVISPERLETNQLIDWIYRHSRVLQWGQYQLSPVVEMPLTEVRVPLPEYVTNLTAIGYLFAERPVIFITPPSTHRQFGVPDYLIEQGFATDKAQVIALHQQYNESLHELATINDWPLLDLAQTMSTRPDLRHLFLSDGIHLTEQGLQVVANYVAEFVAGQACLAG